MRKIFCENCRKYIDYTVTEEITSENFKGTTCEYAYKKAICPECKEEVYVGEIMDHNLDQLKNAYREKNNIISLEKVKEIPDKYQISQRNLALILGWGESTFERFYKGDIPTKQYAATLQEIYDDPIKFSNFLEKNKDYLKSEKAYDKCKSALQNLSINNKTTNKLKIIAAYLWNKRDITTFAQQKMLYYIQGFYYAFMGKYLFTEDCRAWDNGPVYKEIYTLYKYDTHTLNEKPNISIFDSFELAIINSVLQNFGCYSGDMLANFTHQEKPWAYTRAGLPPNCHSDEIIKKELIGEYFTNVKEKYNMMTPSDIADYSRYMFEHNHIF